MNATADPPGHRTVRVMVDVDTEEATAKLAEAHGAATDVAAAADAAARAMNRLALAIDCVKDAMGATPWWRRAWRRLRKG